MSVYKIKSFRSNKSIRTSAALILIISTAVLMGGCKRPADPAASPAKTAAVNQGALISVTPVKTGSISSIAELTGSLTSEHDVTVGVKASNRMSAVYAREGDVVHAGQIIAQQDTTDLKNQLDQQQANLISARTKLEQAKVAYDNAKTTLSLTDAQTKSAALQANAALQAAKDAAAIVKKGSRDQEKQQAKENVAAAQADRDKARSDLKRYQDLYRQQAVSAQQLDQAQATADSADARFNSAQQAYSLTEEGSRPEEIRRANSAVEQANQTLITAQANRDQVTLRKADVDTAKAGILSAQAGVRQAEAAVRLAQQAIRDASIVSPIEGVVAERKVEPGMQVATAKPDVMRIVSLDDIYFDAQLSESQYASVLEGQTVDISVDALPGQKFVGKVKKIFPVANSSARSFTVRIAIANERHMLRPSMFARGQIVLQMHKNALLVPRDTVLDILGDNGRIVIANGDTAEVRKVKIGFTSNNEIEIVSGVKAGEKVVTVGQSQLQDGDKIQIQPSSGGIVTGSVMN